MDLSDAQMEIALLKSVERQAKATSAALAETLRLMREVAALGAADGFPSPKETPKRNPRR